MPLMQLSALLYIITGGVNQDEEKNINLLVKSGQITNCDRMFNDLALIICDKYEQIGIELGLEYQTLCDELGTGMFAMKKGSEKAMKMLQLWQQSVDEDHFTYSVLAAALEKHGHKQAALKFCYTDASSNVRVEARGAPAVNNSNIPSVPVASKHLLNRLSYSYLFCLSLHDCVLYLIFQMLLLQSTYLMVIIIFRVLILPVALCFIHLHICLCITNHLCHATLIIKVYFLHILKFVITIDVDF